VLLSVWGCSQVVDFDRSKIPSGKGGMDGGGNNGTADSGTDGGMSEAGVDAGTDGQVPIDSGSDAGEGGVACNPADHSGCDADELCCDADSDGVFECIDTSTSACSACDMGCDASVSDRCTGRVCTCGPDPVCAGDEPLCDSVNAVCVECVDDNDCMGNAAGEQCVGNVCVACDPGANPNSADDDDGCSGTTPICNSTSKQCEACTAAPDNCPTGQQCLGTGACECSASNDCASPTTPICDTTSKNCRGCASNNECNSERSRPFCIDNQRCSVCQPSTEVGCSDATKPDCRLNGSGEHECQACTQKSHCENKGSLDECDTGTGRCVECTADSQCSDPTKPICDPTTRSCRACGGAGAGDTECSGRSASTPACQTDGSCKACRPNVELSSFCNSSPGKHCGPLATCVECFASNTVQCTAAEPLCDSAECKACGDVTGGDSACGGYGDRTCNETSGQCVECTANADCREVGDDASKTFCATAAGVCVGCRSDADCSGTNDQCLASTSQCVDCDATGGCGTNASCSSNTCACDAGFHDPDTDGNCTPIPPTITSVAPNTGAAGTSITLTGTHFRAGATVTVGGVAAGDVTVVSATSITATVPTLTVGAKDVVVTNTDATTVTSAAAFTVTPGLAPTVSSVAPDNGPSGTSIAVTGTNFRPGATLTVGGQDAQGSVTSSTSIDGTVPAGLAAGTYDLTVTNVDGTTVTSAAAFTVP
jgi:hypothetical protein